MPTVMDAITKYGQRQSYAEIPAATASALPLNFDQKPLNNADEAAFAPQINFLLLQERFGDLDKIAAKARAEKSRHTGGIWVINDFYEAVAEPLTQSPSPKEWDARTAHISNWIVAFPQSATARIALAEAFASSAWNARGDGFAESVDDKSWDIF